MSKWCKYISFKFLCLQANVEISIIALCFMCHMILCKVYFIRLYTCYVFMSIMIVIFVIV